MAREEKIALDKVQVVFVHEGERYQVATPWKHEHPALLINYEMAFSCLRNTEKGFTCQPSLGEDYQNVITSYLEKGYICKVRQAEKICSVSDTSLTSLYAVLTGPLLRRGSCLMQGQSYKIHV